MIVDQVASPLGSLTLAVREGVLVGLTFAEHWVRVRDGLARRFPGEALERGAEQDGIGFRLQRYFTGHMESLDDIVVDPGGTAFQARVWKALRGVRPGRTASYADIARRTRAPAAVRAVGNANGANPICIVIPCHRIIASDGGLGGYGGGLERKRWLLEHEAKACTGAPGFGTPRDPR